GRLLVRQTHLALEGSLHRRYADLQRRLVLVVPERLELFAAGDRLAELLGVEERVPDLLARRGHVVRAFELHPVLLRGGLVYSNLRIAASMRASPSLISVSLVELEECTWASDAESSL